MNAAYLRKNDGVDIFEVTIDNKLSSDLTCTRESFIHRYVK